MAGLLSARVLVDYFDRVTIVERDRFPRDPMPRKGVPQSRHVHVLMLRGRMILEQLFPGLQQEMVARGAPLMDMANEIAWLTPAGWGVRFPSNLQLLAFTRDFLDWSVRRRLAGFAQVRFLEEAEVTRLLPDVNQSGVAGAGARLRNQENGANAGEQLLRADLVVDASGRGSRAPQWLASLGYAPPAETVINGFLGYASRIYLIPREFKSDWEGVFFQAAPPERRRAGLFSPVEGDRWLLTLAGGGRDYPPTDEAGFLEFARSFPSPLIYDAIKGAEPLTPIYSYRATENRLRHFERLARLPANFVILGDAVCAFNPVYGQGMTTAALGALTLERTLCAQRRRCPDGSLAGMARRFQKALARVNAAPWMLATSEDIRYRETIGGTPTVSTRLMHHYMDQVIHLATEHPGVRRTLLEAFHMLKPPSALFRPGISLRVLRHVLTRRLRPLAGIAPGSAVSDAQRVSGVRGSGSV